MLKRKENSEAAHSTVQPPAKKDKAAHSEVPTPVKRGIELETGMSSSQPVSEQEQSLSAVTVGTDVSALVEAFVQQVPAVTKGVVDTLISMGVIPKGNQQPSQDTSSKKTPGDGKVNWCNFNKRQSNSGRYRDKPDNPIMYQHSLPKFPTLEFTEEELHNGYEEFDTVIHVTSLKNAGEILKSQSLKRHKVSDNSVVTGCTYPLTGRQNQETEHPLRNAFILWYGPWKKHKIGDENVTVERYGNVIFSMKCLLGSEGIQRTGLNLYFIEKIKYLTSSACRILVTDITYPNLREYNPCEFGGPWYVSDGKNYFRKKYTLEFMKEVTNYRETWLENHEISFSYCLNPRRGVEAVLKPEDLSAEELKKDYAIQTLRLRFLYPRERKFRFAEIFDKKYFNNALQLLHKRSIESLYDDQDMHLTFMTAKSVDRAYRLFLMSLSCKPEEDKPEEEIPRTVKEALNLLDL